MKKITLFLSLCLASVFAMAEGVYVTPKVDGSSVLPEGISANKKYVVGQSGEGILWMWELETGRFYNIAESGNTDVEIIEPDNNSASAVADNGVVAGSINGVPAYYRNGKWNSLMAEAEQGNAFAITPDASIIAGATWDLNLTTIPLVWYYDAENDTYGLPDTLKFEYPGFVFDGAEVTDISADGKIIAGFVIDNTSGHWLGCLWKYNDETKDYDFDFYSKRVADASEGVFFEFASDRVRISDNGEWLVGERTETNEYWEGGVPARYNIKDDTYEILMDVAAPEGNTVCTDIADDGTVVCFHEDEGAMIERRGYIVPAGKDRRQTAAEYYAEKGVEMPDGFADNMNAVFAISSDARLFVGIFMDAENSIMPYAVDLDGNVTSALNKIEADDNFCSMDGNELRLNDEVSDLRIITVNAQTVYSQAAPASVINLDNLNAGVYVVVANKDGKLVSSKIAVY